MSQVGGPTRTAQLALTTSSLCLGIWWLPTVTPFDKSEEGFLFFNFYLFIYLFLFMIVTQREREAETQAEGEAGSMHREPDLGFDPGSPGSRPGPKAGAKPLRHPGIPADFSINTVEGRMGSSVG